MHAFNAEANEFKIALLLDFEVLSAALENGQRGSVACTKDFVTARRVESEELNLDFTLNVVLTKVC